MTTDEAALILRTEVERLQEQVQRLRRVAAAAKAVVDDKSAICWAHRMTALECAVADLPPGTLLDVRA